MHDTPITTVIEQAIAMAKLEKRPVRILIGEQEIEVDASSSVQGILDSLHLDAQQVPIRPKS